MKASRPSRARSLSLMGGVVIALALCGSACTPKKEKEQSLGGGLPPSEACQKLETIYGKGAFAARQKDECLGMFATFGPNMKVCMDACVNTAKTEPQFKDCSAVCNGRPTIVQPSTSSVAPLTGSPY